MTDLEAIKMLAEIIARVADCASADFARCDALALAEDLAEPAAPTVSQDYLDGVRAGLLEAARQDAEEIENAPTVTRELADRFVAFLRFNGGIGTSDCPARELSGVSEVPMEDRCWACQIGVDEVIVTKDGLDNWPAFFRAVADALDKEA